MVYDVTDGKSFEAVGRWVSEVEKFGSAGVCKVLVACKCDLEGERVVKKEEAAALAKHHGLKFVETSAKDAVRVQEAFKVLTKEMCSKASKRGDLSFQPDQKSKANQQIELSENKKEEYKTTYLVSLISRCC